MIFGFPVPFNDIELISIGIAFLIAGMVKGVIGGGLPAVAVPIMAGTVEPALAASLTLMPVIVTNIWQVLQGGLLGTVIRRYWPMLLALAIGSALGSQILVTAPPEIMALAIGAMVVALSPLPYIPKRWSIPETKQRWLNPLVGLVLGTIGGATVLIAPMILYLVALKLEKNMFVASLGAAALCSMTPLYLGLASSRVLGLEELVMSAAAFVPAGIGMAIGIALRDRISQSGFQRLLSLGLLAVGLNLIRKSLGALP